MSETRTASPPLWASVSAQLLAEMEAGRLPDGTRLAPEREMAAEMGVAVGTLRRALADLTSKGVLERVQGSGNYVRAGGLRQAVYGFFRLEPESGDGAPSARLISLDLRPAPEGSALSGEAHRIRRLRLLGGLACAVEEIWLDGAAAPSLDPADLSDGLYLSYRTRLGLEIVEVEDRAGAGSFPDWAGELEPGAPCGHVLRHARDREGRVREVSRTWFDPSRCSYVNRMGRRL